MQTTQYKRKDIVRVVDKSDPWYGRVLYVTGQNLYGLAFCTWPSDRHNKLYTSVEPLCLDITGRIFTDDPLAPEVSRR
jgi:hypothetical protein